MTILSKLRPLLEPELDAVFCYCIAEVESGCRILNIRGNPTVFINPNKFKDLVANYTPLLLAKANKRVLGHNWQSYEAAYDINSKFAMLSSAYGLFQVKGELASKLGYSTVYTFVENMRAGLEAQVDAFKRVVKYLDLAPLINANNIEDFSAIYHKNDNLPFNYQERLKKSLRSTKARLSNIANATNKENSNG